MASSHCSGFYLTISRSGIKLHTAFPTRAPSDQYFVTFKLPNFNMMISKIYRIFFLLTTISLFVSCNSKKTDPAKIDREALVRRHNVKITQFDTLGSLTVGNGKFAFTVDATGLQSFPDLYNNGISLGTQSEWGWHSFPDTADYRFEETLKNFDFHGRMIPYDVQVKEPVREVNAANYFRQNPHRLHLGIIGLELKTADGKIITSTEITNLHQELDLWEGVIRSSFKVNGEEVNVVTCCSQEKDLISAEITSSLIAKGLLSIKIRFPYPSGGHVDSGCDWSRPESHQTKLIENNAGKALIEHRLDSTSYYTEVGWSGTALLTSDEPHVYKLEPGKGEKQLSFSTSFSLLAPAKTDLPSFTPVLQSSKSGWKKFWESGGAVDFSGSTDPRANELERRVILSQYLTKVQCEGSYPPQETGLTSNSWYGKPHLEMHWWHGVHFALWNRIELLEKSLAWYSKISGEARKIAQRQGFEGVRWPKMVSPDGLDSPSGVGPFLIWQQPHIIYFAELCYRNHQDTATLNRYAELVDETADFMSSFAFYDEKTDRYILGPPLIPAQECFDPKTTFNPPFELSYWHWGLTTAQQWRKRLGLAPKKEWDDVLAKLSVPAQSEGIYLATESTPDSYTNPRFTTDHPTVLGAFGYLPGSPLIDTLTMKKTFNYIWQNWQWNKTWGWDFPLTAMTATRIGMPEKALDALFMDVVKNTYLVNGHNYQDKRLRLYLPGNGGVLAAVAMMCAGFDGCKTDLPGFPHDGSWKVRWENLAVMP